MSAGGASVGRVADLVHRYGPLVALDQVSLDLPAGKLIGLIGPDGVGKSTLLSLIAGAKRIQTGRVEVLGGDMADRRHRAAICRRIAFMPQGLGRNLYPDLSVTENIAFFAQLFGQGRKERAHRIADLLAATGLAPFADRIASKLSGGMRQKLGLCCALVHDPDLLILDEPTTGVDPLSRRQFWDLIARLRAGRAAMSVVVATAYMEEAEGFDWLIAMEAGRILATGTPQFFTARTGQTELEDSIIALLPEARRRRHRPLTIPPRRASDGNHAIVARGLTRRFGDFTAVDGVSFTIAPGEIFGFVGSNGCGKTTTMKMLTGLLPASTGEALIIGRPIDTADMSLRERVGYMSQSFSLYTELTVRQNLELHARLFHLPPERARKRIASLLHDFELEAYVDHHAADLPLGIRQRLSLAVAVVHEPELLILDEPTSGVDPLARDEFWRLLIDLSRHQGVTIFVSTHFMNEASRCDRVALMDGGKVLAIGAPAALTAARNAATLEDAFVDFLIASRGGPVEERSSPIAASAEDPPMAARRDGFSPGRLLAYARREMLEFWRDPVRMAFALLGTAFLMVVFGVGITTDVDHIRFAVLDRDHSVESRAYLKDFRFSPYFDEEAPLADYAGLERRLQRGAIGVALEMPPGFGRDVRSGRPTEVGAWVDGAMPFRGETVRGYVEGVHDSYLAGLAAAHGETVAAPASIETRFRYNQDFKSIYAMVPGTIALLLAMFPAILMALAVVREKELGSIANLYVTPVTRLEFLLGKQLPYIGVAFVNFLTQYLMATLIFEVPLKGSFWCLAVGALIYVTATTAYGLVISAFTRTQIAALFGTAILTSLPAVQFSGLLTPVSSLSGPGAAMGHLFPMMYFLRVSVGTFTKALGFAELGPSLLAIAAFVPALLGLSLVLLRKQER